MTLTIPVWAIWVGFALWPWAVVLVTVAMYEPTGGWFDMDFLTLGASIFALAWTLAVVVMGGMQWLILN